MPSPFEIASAISPAGTNRFTAEIPDGYLEGNLVALNQQTFAVVK